MAQTIEENITSILEALKDTIISNIENKGIKASGRTQSTIKVEKYDRGIRLIAAAGERAPIPTLEIGRPAGKVPQRFYLILTQWSQDKGIQFSTERERKTFAYFLGKRIAQKGTIRHFKQPENVYSDAVEQAAEKIKNIILVGINEQIKHNFK